MSREPLWIPGQSLPPLPFHIVYVITLRKSIDSQDVIFEEFFLRAEQ